jgi:hypothetical protein
VRFLPTPLYSGERGWGYSTYLGGFGQDEGNGIAVEGDVPYLTGLTSSINFPGVGESAQPALGGDVDAFVMKIASGGGAIVYATYLGGNGYDGGNGIAVHDGFAYVTGFTNSDNTTFPLVNPKQAMLGGGQDAFVTKVAQHGAAFVYSTYLGGAETDEGLAIALLGTNALVTGRTRSNAFPLFNPHQATRGGDSDAFLTWYNTAGSAYSYSSYLGGDGRDTAPQPPAEKDLGPLWDQLGDVDPAKAYQAVWTLVRSPKLSLPYLHDMLAKSAAKVDPKRVAKLIKELDDNEAAALVPLGKWDLLKPSAFGRSLLPEGTVSPLCSQRPHFASSRLPQSDESAGMVCR